ncbi:MAG: hypothetical protein ACRD5L_07535, partial [Bryobacteraceae bacterium]
FGQRIVQARNSNQQQTAPAAIVPAGSLQDAIAKAPVGVHTLRNGSTLEKRADGTVLLNGKQVQ